MKKLLAVMIMLGTLFISGCFGPEVNDAPNNDLEQENITEPDGDLESEPEQTGKPASLAGISLGDSADVVSELLGDSYTEDKQEDEGFFGEGYTLRQYDGIDVVIGLESQMVLQVDVYGSQFTTGLGDSVGDKANEVLEKYRSEYDEFEGVNSDGKLTGWFQITEDELLIFSFNEDRSRFNEEVTEDTLVGGITLGYTYFFH